MVELSEQEKAFQTMVELSEQEQALQTIGEEPWDRRRTQEL